ncbi:MAG TPA: hypothetical protein VF544_17225 [Pyrinomonadaceae bacterium]|jgi:hypothetical protein
MRQIAALWLLLFALTCLPGSSLAQSGRSRNAQTGSAAAVINSDIRDSTDTTANEVSAEGETEVNPLCRSPGQAGQSRQIKVRVRQPSFVVTARDSYIYSRRKAADTDATPADQPRTEQSSKPSTQGNHLGGTR